MIKNNEEVWKEIKKFPNYLISNLGNVKSKNFKRTGKEKLLTPKINNKGYQFVGFSQNGKMYYFTVHRLVANAFIENKENKKCVNHIDGDKLNNNVKNLEWNTHKENSHHAYHQLCKMRELTTYNINKRKPILCVETGEIFSHSKLATIKYGYNYRHINECCNGKRKSSNGYHWSFA